MKINEGEKMIYKLINEDNTLVNEYPAPQIYKTLSDEEKNNIYTFKKEIEKICNQMESFSKKNNLFDFYLGCHILLMG